MADYIEPVERLADMFRRLDGIGKKTAVRLAFSVLNFSDAEAHEFAEAILAVKNELTLCRECQNISTTPVCSICANDERDHKTICVVEDSKAIMAFEKVKEYRGMYHVLHGAISPMRGIGPDQLKIKELLSRLNNSEVEEVIIATNPTVEGEATSMYLTKLISPIGIKVTRIANGVPVGGDLEYVDEITLRRALEGRYKMN